MLNVQRPMERRAAARRAFRAPVRLWLDPDDRDFFVLDCCNVSERGLFLATELLFPLGQRLQVELEVHGRPRPIRRLGRVVRVFAADEAPGPGIALQLDGLTPAERGAMARA